MRYEVCNPAEVMPNITDLLVMNWRETGNDFEYSPDLAMYQMAWETGTAYAVCAFTDDDQCVGYATVIMFPHAFNPKILVAHQDAMFVHPDYRCGFVPGRIMRMAEKEADARGAIRFTVCTRADTRFAEMLMNHGYVWEDILVSKEL